MHILGFVAGVGGERVKDRGVMEGVLRMKLFSRYFKVTNIF